MKTATIVVESLVLMGVLAMASVSAPAQHAHGTSPYAHARSADVASLSPEEVHELRNGEGMGLARAAELNHFPGPKHLLELAPELGLSDAQLGRLVEIHGNMKARAIARRVKPYSKRSATCRICSPPGNRRPRN